MKASPPKLKPKPKSISCNAIAAFGSELDEVGILGYQDHHIWKIKQGDYSDVLWGRLVKKLDEAIAHGKETPYCLEQK